MNTPPEVAGDTGGPTLRTRMGMLVLYALYLVLVTEGVARVAYAIPAVERRLLSFDDLTSRRIWVDRHREGGYDGRYVFDRWHPQRGWMSQPMLRDLTVFDQKVLNTNTLGLRGVREYAPQPSAGRTRIVVLGDSFTFGDDVSDDETYSFYLQQLLPGAEVINMGVHGYGHDQMLLLLEEEGLALNPDIVLLGFLHLDMPRNLHQFRDFAKPRFEVDGEQLTLTGVPVPRPEEVLQHDWMRPRFLDLLSSAVHRIDRASGSFHRRKQVVTSAILNRITHVAHGAGAAMVLAYLPSASEIHSDKVRSSGESFLERYCADVQKVYCHSVRPLFLEQRAAGTAFVRSGHWAPTGHRTAAAAIATYLSSQGLVTNVTDVGADN